MLEYTISNPPNQCNTVKLKKDASWKTTRLKLQLLLPNQVGREANKYTHQHLVIHVTDDRCTCQLVTRNHDDVTIWNRFPDYWPFVREIHRSPGRFCHQWPIMRSSHIFCRWHERAVRQGVEVPVIKWHHMTALISVNIGSGNGLLPNGTKPLPEPILTYHQ